MSSSATPLPLQGHVSLGQVAQISVQPDLEHFQWWGIDNFSGQPVPVHGLE